MPEVIARWISTALLCLVYPMSAFLAVTERAWTRQALADLGYPAYLVPFMAAVKIAGPAVILSRFSVALSDLACAGLFNRPVPSGLAHLGVRKPLWMLPAVIGPALPAASFTTRNTARAVPSPYPMAAAF